MTTKRYSEDFETPHEMTRTGEFWTFDLSPDPNLYTGTFTADGGDGDLGFKQAKGTGSNWFQVDEVAISRLDTVKDSYDIFVREYPDAEDTNGQLFNEISEFPNKIGDLLVPINEYATHTSMNDVFGKMGENYNYLIEKSKFLSLPPTALQFRYGKVVSGLGYRADENAWIQDANTMYRYWDYVNLPLKVKNVTANSTKMFYSYNIGMGSEILVAAVVGVDDYNPLTTNDAIEDDRDFYVFGADKFTDIIALDVLSNGRVILMDKVVLVNTDPNNPTSDEFAQFGIFTHEDNWQFEDIWTADPYNTIFNASRTFIKPTDMKVHDGRVYIACQGDAINNQSPTIKVMNELGSLLALYPKQTFSDVKYEFAYPIESLAITTDRVVALSQGELYMFDKDLRFIERVTFEQEDLEIKTYKPDTTGYNYVSQITELANNTNGSFFYGIAGNQRVEGEPYENGNMVFKFGEDGSILESFGETAVNYMNYGDSTTGVQYKPITAIFHDPEYNLYVGSDIDVIKYYDRVQEGTRLLEDLSFNIEDSEWTVDETTVDMDEYSSAWVYNRIFDRILANLNIFRLALKGPIAKIKTKSFEKVTVDNFSYQQYTPLTYTKDEIAVGVNEIHCEGALNRCIRKLHTCFEDSLAYLNYRGDGVDPDILDLTNFRISNPIGKSVEIIDGSYVYDYGRSINPFTFEWDDTYIHRHDLNLIEIITPPNGNPVKTFGPPVPNQWADPNTYVENSEAGLTWTISASYLSYTETQEVNVKWKKRAYFGSMIDSLDMTTTNINDNATFTSLRDEFDTTYSIPVSDGYRYFIAIPTEEITDGSFKMLHPDLGWEYEPEPFGTDTILHYTAKFGGDAGQYSIFRVGYNTNEGVVYRDGVEEVKFRVLRGVV